jgi:hypothetical protein
VTSTARSFRLRPPRQGRKIPSPCHPAASRKRKARKPAKRHRLEARITDVQRQLFQRAADLQGRTYAIELLGKHHDRAAFSCGVDQLNRYFRQQVGQESRRHVANCFVAVDQTTKAIGGFYIIRYPRRR